MPNVFSYDDFVVDDDRQTVHFNYSLTQDDNSYRFSEQLRFPVAVADGASLQRALRSLHLALGVSYYKIFVSPEINQPYAMDQAEADFWNNVWRHGLGEFLYVNKLHPARLAQFSAQTGAAFEPAEFDSGQGAILGIGGGKDSIVAGKLLQAIDQPLEGFVMATGEQRGQAQAVSDQLGLPLHVVERTLDQTLLTVQQQPGAYRGHVPISLIFGLVGVVLALATGKKYVVVANEAAASIPRTSWEHGNVNHQWSKSLEFERSLQSQVSQQVAAVNYFSAVRPLTSVAIAKLFARYPAFLPIFTSDNSVFRIDPAQRPAALWSLESPKSLSSFMLLAPWLSETALLQTFGRDFLDLPELETLFWELTGQQGEPPLDCVGTVEELVLSLNLTQQQGKFTNSQLMRLAQQKQVVRSGDWSAQLQGMLTLQSEHALPLELEPQLVAKLQEWLA